MVIVMKLTKPYFYDEFVCTASRCTDNCCIGWEIDIDEPAMARFHKAGGEFGERLRGAIHRGEDGVHTFAFGEGERCALLRQDGLCELILNMGENSLCDICALHPRFFGWYNGLKEAGLGLCCEEVCRLLFSDSAPLSFIDGEIDEPYEETCNEALLQQLLTARGRLFALLQNREVPLCDRLYSAKEYAEQLQDALDFGGELPNPDILPAPPADLAAAREMLELYAQMESISAEWDARLAALTAQCGRIYSAMEEFCALYSGEMWRYEHIAVYFGYRWFLDGVFQREVYSRIGIVLAATFTVLMMDCLTWLEKGEITERDRIDNLKLYSKQVEYSEENMELLFEAAQFDDFSAD